MAKRLLSIQRIVNLSSDPGTGSAGEIYYNTTLNAFKYYNGTSWSEIQGGGGGATVTVSETAPTSPEVGDLWYDSSVAKLFIYYDSTWVEAGGSGGGGGIESVSEDASPELGGNLDASGFNISNVDNLSFETTPEGAGGIATLVWDDGEGTLSLGLKGGNVNLQIGQENIALCYNGTGSTITKGSVVYISGAQGQRPSITLSDADTEATSSKTFGVVAENISDGAEGFVCTFGIVTGINTSSFTAGQTLWLSSSAGQLTNVKPTQPAHAVFIGYCLSVNASSGRIFVNPQNGYELQELHNVLINGIADNHILSYDNATSLWKNQGLAAAIQEVDGASSGIDADLLDGQHASYFLDTSANSQTKSGDLVISGNLTVNGTTTTIDTVNLLVEDKNIELGVVASPTDTTADGGGITLRGTTNKTFNWVDSTDAWTSSEHLNLVTGKAYYINGVNVLSSTALGSGVTSSSLASVGTITSGIWQATVIAAAYIDSSIARLASPTFTGTVTIPTLSLTTVDTSTTASHYFVETASDGIVRPKTLSDVRSEIVTTTSVNSAAATTVGTITSGTWQGNEISTTYTAAKVTSVNGATGAITGLATTSALTAHESDTTNVHGIADTSQLATNSYVQTNLEVTELDSYSFDGLTSRFIPKYLGQIINLGSPIRLVININGIIQEVTEKPSTVWLSGWATSGYYIDNYGYIVLPEQPEAGSVFEGRLLPGVDMQKRPESYPFKAIDIYLGD